MRPLIAMAITMLLCSHCAAQKADDEKLLGQEEQSIQEQINRVFDAFKNHPNLDPASNVAAFEEIQKLKNFVESKSEIVTQVAILAAKPGEGQPLYARMILELLDIPPKIVIRTLAPYLDADNKNLRSFVRDWFQSHDNAGSDLSALEEVHYEDYLEYVRVQQNMKQDIVAAFTEYIYERHPGKGLLVFTYANRQDDVVDRLQEMRKNFDARLQQENDGRGPIPPLPPPKEEKPEDRIRRLERQQFQFDRSEILLAEHIVSNAIWLKKNKFDEQFQKALPEAKEELDMLSEHSQWWVRLYVAEIMRRHRELRLADVLDKLSSDDNALVSEAAKAVKR